jgi:hypothetical protein
MTDREGEYPSPSGLEEQIWREDHPLLRTEGQDRASRVHIVDGLFEHYCESED